MMASVINWMRVTLLAAAVLSLSGCDDPQVYGSVGVSTGFSSHHGGWSPRVHTSVSVGGRIR